MKNALKFLIPFIFVSCFGPHFPEKNNVTSTIPNGYYTGYNRFSTTIYVAVEKNSARVDFILFDKYPRELLSDTLLLDESSNNYFGRHCYLCSKNGKYYINTIDTLKIFGRTFNSEIKLNEKYYKRVIDEHKNFVTWHKFQYWCFTNPDYTADILTDFYTVGNENNIDLKIITLKHKDFLEALKKVKRETDSLDLKKQ